MNEARVIEVNAISFSKRERRKGGRRRRSSVRHANGTLGHLSLALLLQLTRLTHMNIKNTHGQMVHSTHTHTHAHLEEKEEEKRGEVTSLNLLPLLPALCVSFSLCIYISLSLSLSLLFSPFYNKKYSIQFVLSAS